MVPHVENGVVELKMEHCYHRSFNPIVNFQKVFDWPKNGPGDKEKKKKKRIIKIQRFFFLIN